MEFIGKIVNIGAVREGSNEKGSWRVRNIVLESQDTEYPQSICLAARGTMVDRLNDLLSMQQPGQADLVVGIYKARISCKARHYEKQDGSVVIVNDLYCNQLERL